MSAYTDMIREIAMDETRVNRHGEMIGELTAAELDIAYDAHGLDADDDVLDDIRSLRAWCTERDPQTALAKLRSLRLLIDEQLNSYAAVDVFLSRIPDDHDDGRAEQADRKRDADIADGVST